MPTVNYDSLINTTMIGITVVFSKIYWLSYTLLNASFHVVCLWNINKSRVKIASDCRSSWCRCWSMGKPPCDIIWRNSGVLLGINMVLCKRWELKWSYIHMSCLLLLQVTYQLSNNTAIRLADNLCLRLWDVHYTTSKSWHLYCSLHCWNTFR
jgi:hypothetical protein